MDLDISFSFCIASMSIAVIKSPAETIVGEAFFLFEPYISKCPTNFPSISCFNIQIVISASKSELLHAPSIPQYNVRLLLCIVRTVNLMLIIAVCMVSTLELRLLKWWHLSKFVFAAFCYVGLAALSELLINFIIASCTSA